MKNSALFQTYLLLPTVLGGVINVPSADRLVSRAGGQPGSCFSIQKVAPLEEFKGCPAKKPMTDATDGKVGYCEPSPRPSEKCSAYCETYLKWKYGKEQPYDNAYCGKDSTCQLQESNTVTVTQTAEFSMGVAKDIFSAGASFSYSESSADMQGITRDKPEGVECGYWTFIPHVISSCGYTGIAERKGGPAGHCKDRKDEFKCQDSILQVGDGKISGDSIFVATDCDSRKPERWCKQDPIYMQKYVSNYPSVYDDYVAASVDRDIKQGPTEEKKKECLAEK